MDSQSHEDWDLSDLFRALTTLLDTANRNVSMDTMRDWIAIWAQQGYKKQEIIDAIYDVVQEYEYQGNLMAQIKKQIDQNNRMKLRQLEIREEETYRNSVRCRICQDRNTVHIADPRELKIAAKQEATVKFKRNCNIYCSCEKGIQKAEAHLADLVYDKSEKRNRLEYKYTGDQTQNIKQRAPILGDQWWHITTDVILDSKGVFQEAREKTDQEILDEFMQKLPESQNTIPF